MPKPSRPKYTLFKIGVPCHFRPSSEPLSACGVEHPELSAYDGRDVNCLSCKRTKAWKTYMGKTKASKKLDKPR